MTIVDPFTGLLTFHGAVLAASLTAYFRYGDRSEQFEKSMKGLSDTLGALKRVISGGLAEHLRPVLENAGSVTSVLLDPSGKQFQENYVSPIGSEAFRDAFFAFIQCDSETICDLRKLIETRDCWLFWSRVQSWTCLSTLVAESLVTAGFFFAVKVMSVQFDLRLGLFSVLLPLLGFVIFTVASVKMAFLHDRFVDLRKRYANP